MTAQASGLVKFLLENPVADLRETVSIPGRLKDFEFTVRPMSGAEYSAWQKAALKTRRTRKGTESTFDNQAFNISVVLNCVEEPDFRDDALMKKAGARRPEEMIATFFLPGEIQELVEAISELSGFIDDEDSLVVEGKASSTEETETPG